MTSPHEILSDLRARAIELGRDHLDPDAADLLEELARPAIRLSRSDRVTRSHLGGSAVLSDRTAWPRWDQKPLSLVAVLDLEDIAAFTIDIPLPDRGVVNFFYEAEEQQAWGFEPSHRDGWRVIYTEPDDADSTPAPEGALVFPTIGLVMDQTLTIPDWEEPAVESLVPAHKPNPRSRLQELMTRRSHEREQRNRQAYFDLVDTWRKTVAAAGPHHQLGGWPSLQQNPIWKECDIVSRGLPLGNSKQWNDPRVTALPNTQADWRLLLQLDTDDQAGWMWGDVGMLYFAMRDSVERPEAFRDAWMVFQCG